MTTPNESAPAATTTTSTPEPPAAPAVPKPDVVSRIAAEQQKRQAEVQRKELEALRVKAKEADEYKAWRDGLRTNPDLLKDVFGDRWYDVLTDAQINGGRLTPEQIDAKVDAKLAELEKARQKESEEAATAEKEQAEQTRQAWCDDLAQYIKADTATYRLVNKHNAHEAVAQHIEQNYKATGKLMSDEEGAKAVEAQIRAAILDSIDDSLYAEIVKMRQPAQAAPRQSGQPAAALHNGMAGGVQSQGKLTRDQRREAAFKKWDERSKQ